MEVTSPYSWADLSITVILYYRRLDTLPDFSLSSPVVGCESTVAPPSLDLSTLPSPVPHPAEAAAIYAALRVYSDDSTVTIYTDSQAAIDGLNSYATSTYTNSRLYYKTTNFKLWAAIESSL
ncbi:hypothetical protein GLOIN_2v1783661 [Rhizophagus clarus]|uniref:RNase H type-1 domain-containing protein n=1 Tax=Rhizophagus clarus TaxID=94130 RepID=A0A8H3QCS8_9GLOM|nr:hypothetical protein GLOIN_2v1783661 [Rhizophagus clarus]